MPKTDTTEALKANMDTAQEAATIAANIAIEKDRVELEREVRLAQQISDERLEELRRAATARAKAPDGIVVTPFIPQEHEIDRLVKQYVPEAIEEHGDRRNPTKVTKPATMRTLFDGATHHRQHLSEGWVPVVVNGRHMTNSGGDLMYKRPIELTRAARERASAEARQMLRGIDEELKAKDPAREVLTESETSFGA